MLSALALFMLAMLPGHPAHSAPTVPWLNQPAAEKAGAIQAAAPSARACASSDLRIAAGAAGAYRGQATQEIRLTNIGADACHLAGFPSVQLLAANEAPQTVGASEAAPQLANERLELAPGDEVVMLLGTPGVCEAANQPQRKISNRLQLALPGGGMKVLDGVHIDTLCGRATVVSLQAVQSEAAVNARSVKRGATLSQLTGTLSAPDEATRGSTLRYTVTLSNPTANPISLASCPAYTQSLYVDGKAADSTMRLNCGAAGAQIAANSSVSFEMQAQVPAELPAGTLKLSWKLQDGPGVGKIISLR
ncbi:MAG: DUF4232 domain-containing protein [Massilia sp.]